MSGEIDLDDLARRCWALENEVTQLSHASAALGRGGLYKTRASFDALDRLLALLPPNERSSGATAYDRINRVYIDLVHDYERALSTRMQVEIIPSLKEQFASMTDSEFKEAISSILKKLPVTSGLAGRALSRALSEDPLLLERVRHVFGEAG